MGLEPIPHTIPCMWVAYMLRLTTHRYNIADENILALPSNYQ